MDEWRIWHGPSTAINARFPMPEAGSPRAGIHPRFEEAESLTGLALEGAVARRQSDQPNRRSIKSFFSQALR